MKKHSFLKMTIPLLFLTLVAPLSPASAAGSDVAVGSTSLGNIVVDGKGMTAYYYDPDVPNSGVSSCVGACLVHWPAIMSASPTPVVTGITAKVTVIASTNQIELNGRPIYTFAGDQKPGDTHGQGVGGIWYVVSPAGTELTAAELAKEAQTPAPTKTATSTPKPTPSKVLTKTKPKTVSKAKAKAKAKSTVAKKSPTKAKQSTSAKSRY